MIKLKQRSLTFFVLFIMTALVVLLNGCEPENTGALFSDADCAVLKDYAAYYREVRGTQSEEDARAVLLDALKADPDVSDARFCADGYSFRIEFADGFHGVLDTQEGFADGTPVDMSALDSAYRAEAGGKDINTAAGMPALIPLSVKSKSNCPDSPPSPPNKKVLLLNAAGSRFHGVDDHIFPFIKSALAEQNNWDENDITVKSNANDTKVHFSDFFNLQDYGVIVIASKLLIYDGGDLEEPEKGVYIHVSPHEEYFAPDTHEIIQHADDPFNLEEQHWLGRIELVTSYISTDGIPDVWIRGDLWEDYVNLAPGALVYLAFNYGFTMVEPLMAKGAGEILSWSGQVFSQEAAQAMYAIPFMGLLNISARGFLTSGLTETTIGDGFDSVLVSAAAPSDIYLPTWLNTSVTISPAEAQTVITEISYADAALCPPLTNSVQDIPSSPNTFMGLIPGVEMKVIAKAMSNQNALLAEAQKSITLNSGANNISVAFTNTASEINILTAEPTIFDANVGGNVTLSAGVVPPVAGVPVSFKSSIPGLVIVGKEPVLTNDQGKAISTGEVIALPGNMYNGRQIVTVTATSEGVDPRACTVDYCCYTRFSGSFSGASDPYLEGDETEFGVNGVRFIFRANGVQLYYSTESSNTTLGAWEMRDDLKPGDLVEFEVDFIYANSFLNPMYLHFWNCNAHYPPINITVEGVYTFTIP